MNTREQYVMNFLVNENRARIHLSNGCYFLVYNKKKSDGSYKTIYKEGVNGKTFNRLLNSNHIEPYRGTSCIWVVSDTYLKYLGKQHECIESI